jgi:hypothetical protein
MKQYWIRGSVSFAFHKENETNAKRRFLNSLIH